MKNRLKLTTFEICLITVSLLVVVASFVFASEKNYLSLVTTIVGIITCFAYSKAWVIAPMVGTVNNILYIILSFTQRFYGEAIIYLFLQMPIVIIQIVDYLKHKNKDDATIVNVNKVSKKEYLLMIPSIIVLTVGFYFLLKALNTNELLISTFSLVTSLVAAYLMLRRSPYYAIGYLLNDIVLIVLWSMTIATSGLAYLPTLLGFVVFMANDIYGFVNWKIQEKKQKASAE